MKKKQATQIKKYYSLKEVSGMIGLARKIIYIKMKNNDFPKAYKTSTGKIFFSVKEIDHWIRIGILPRWIGPQKPDPKDISPMF